jgi:hypothetical protein
MTLDYENGGMAETMMPQRGGRLDGTECLSIRGFDWIETMLTSALERSVLRSLILDKKTIRVKF